jgi:PAN domain/Caspase domain
VGINDYREITPLQKVVGDAEALKVTLERLGFSVDLVLNADRIEFNCAVSAFQTSLDPGDTALVHFSGHGVEIDGQNYLLPADIPKPQSGQQDFSLGGTRGLARVDAPAGTFIFYSAGYQQTALDCLNDADEEPTSVYTRVLTKKLAEAFAAAKEIGTDAAWDAFLTRFPEGFYADMARAAGEKLARGSESDSIPPSVEPATPSPLGGEVFEADMELNTDRPGYDYRNFDLTTPDPRLCKAQCEAEAPCLSWTYVLPGVQAANARCWLKKAVPRTLANGCCVSGIKRLGQARRAR